MHRTCSRIPEGFVYILSCEAIFQQKKKKRITINGFPTQKKPIKLNTSRVRRNELSGCQTRAVQNERRGGEVGGSGVGAELGSGGGVGGREWG